MSESAKSSAASSGADAVASRVDIEARARQTQGWSASAVKRMAGSALASAGASGRLMDVGCGTGGLRVFLPEACTGYVGIDLVKYDGFPEDAEHIRCDLDRAVWDLPAGEADVAVAVEVIEHVENPRLFVRNLARLVRPGGWVMVTTPNQLSWRSRLSLLTRGVYPAFLERPGLYPGHITALLEIDLRRIFQESGLCEITVHVSGSGLIPFGLGRWPRRLASGRLGFSDNIGILGRVPDSSTQGEG